MSNACKRRHIIKKGGVCGVTDLRSCGVAGYAGSFILRRMESLNV